MNVVLYTTHCPQCIMLESALKSKGVQFEISFDADEIIRRGYHTAPILVVDDKTLSFAEAVRWVNSLDGENNGAG